MASSELPNKDFMLIVSGSDKDVPFLEGWQEFKDSLRKVVHNQPGWTDVRDGPGQGHKQGWCRFDKLGDAEAAKDTYTKRKWVLVHIFETSRVNGSYKMLFCNCPLCFLDLSENSHSPNRSGIHAGSFYQNLAATGGTIAPYAGTVSSIHSSQGYARPSSLAHSTGYAQSYSHAQPSGYTQSYSYLQPPVYQQPPMYPTPPTQSAYFMQDYYQPQQTPAYSSSSGLSVNVSGGAMLTEASGIFISGLSYQAGYTELDQLLLNVPHKAVQRNLRMDKRTQMFKGNATATYSTREMAEDAVQYLNGKVHMGKTINVRLDHEPTVIGRARTPAIANGSITQGYNPPHM
ncbi:hypothetical protein B0J11DRAFT_505693 [Dendryphion nanum]|uniref:RRM domain-containing protein n=1 Tax=Dendryphion nanum TaxID=256645 RepID=A0A9P9DVI7_9PLEO|nr:hypothetical protein B0J11DRAFT_505693 [Dendryphion nanum]